MRREDPGRRSMRPTTASALYVIVCARYARPQALVSAEGVFFSSRLTVLPPPIAKLRGTQTIGLLFPSARPMVDLRSDSEDSDDEDDEDVKVEEADGEDAPAGEPAAERQKEKQRWEGQGAVCAENIELHDGA